MRSLAFVLSIGVAWAVEHPRAVVIVSADAEWRQVHKLFPSATYKKQLFGKYFHYDCDTLIAQGGWGKISAAASAQYVVERYKILAVTKTIVYDVVENSASTRTPASK